MQPHLENLEEIRERLLRLEAQNWRLKQIGALALIGVAALLLMGQTSPKKTVEANAFILRDAKGNIRASLLIDEKTSAAKFILFDTKGKQSMKVDSGFLPMSGVGATLTLADEQGRDRVALSANDHTGGAVALTDDKGQGVSVLTTDHATLPYLTAKLIETPKLVLATNDNQEQRGLLWVDEDKVARLALTRADGKEAFIADPTEIGFVDSRKVVRTTLDKNALYISDEQGFAASLGATELTTPRPGGTQKTSAAALVLFDNNKKVLWEVPR